MRSALKSPANPPMTTVESVRKPPKMPATRDFITLPARDVEAWADRFDAGELPLLAATADALALLRADEDAVDAHRLTEIVADDPLLTLRLLAHVCALRRGRGAGEIETVTEALVMLGVPPFFRSIEGATTVELALADRPLALAGLRAVLRRAHRAARFATSFAAHRVDRDAPVIRQAALLHDFAELLLWWRAPDLALEIQRRQQADAMLRSADAQLQLLHVELPQLQHTLMLRWGLPRLLVHITDPHHGREAQVQNVLLAIRVARHSSGGWDNAALPDDVRDVAALLNLGAEPTWRLLKEIDCD